MIACACIKSSSPSSSKNHILKTPKKLTPCKSCRDKVLVDDQTSLQVSMVSNDRGFQLSKSIDPQLKWKNGRQRAVRKARTSIVWSNIKFYENKISDSINVEEDMPISESEKVGVSILGRRFRGTSGNAPPKKRKIPSHLSLSSPQCPSSTSDDLSHAMLKRKQDSSRIADFSGISILAEVACDSNLGSLKENTDLVLSQNMNVLPVPQISGADLPSDASCLSSAMHCEKSMNEVKSNDSIKSSQNVSCKTSEFTSNKAIPILDLNAAAHECLEHEAIYSRSKNTDQDGTNNSEQLMSKDLSGNSKIVEGEKIKIHDIEVCNVQPVTEDANVSQTAKNSILTPETVREEEEKAEASIIPLQLKADTENPSSHLASCNGLIAAKGSSCTDRELFSSHFEESDALNRNSCDKTTQGLGFAANSPKTVISNSHHGNPEQKDIGECHDEANGMEKLDCLSDDDSQYEDGELREPLTDGEEDDDGADIADHGSDRDDKTASNVTPEVSNDASVTRNDVSENSHRNGKEVCSPSRYRNISSSWDRLPGRCNKKSYNDSKDGKYYDDRRISPSRSSRGYNPTARPRPSFCRDLTRVSHSRDGFKDRRSRSIERNVMKPRPQAIQRNTSYDTHCHSRNAVAEKIVDMERNGFVVAPDGTIVKAKPSSSYSSAPIIDRGRNYNIYSNEVDNKHHLSFRRYNNAAPLSPPPRRNDFENYAAITSRFREQHRGVEGQEIHYSRYDSYNGGRGRSSGRFCEVPEENNGYMKREWYDDEGFSPRQRYVFERRDGPRVFDR